MGLLLLTTGLLIGLVLRKVTSVGYAIAICLFVLFGFISGAGSACRWGLQYSVRGELAVWV